MFDARLHYQLLLNLPDLGNDKHFNAGSNDGPIGRRASDDGTSSTPSLSLRPRHEVGGVDLGY